MRTSFHHQPEAQHPNFPLSVSWQADYPIFWHIATLRYDAPIRSLLDALRTYHERHERFGCDATDPSATSSRNFCCDAQRRSYATAW
jgi:hypothetical protein